MANKTINNKMFGFDGRTYWEKLTSKSSLLIMVQLKILVTVQHRKIFLIFSSTMIIWMKSFDTLLLTPVRKEMKPSQLVVRKFQPILD